MLLKHYITLSRALVVQHNVTKYLLTFYQNKPKHAKLNGSNFEKDKDCFDGFYVQELCILPYKEMSFVIKINLTMSHGQAAVEKGFNINNLH